MKYHPLILEAIAGKTDYNEAAESAIKAYKAYVGDAKIRVWITMPEVERSRKQVEHGLNNKRISKYKYVNILKCIDTLLYVYESNLNRRYYRMKYYVFITSVYNSMRKRVNRLLYGIRFSFPDLCVLLVFPLVGGWIYLVLFLVFVLWMGWMMYDE